MADTPVYPNVPRHSHIDQDHTPNAQVTLIGYILFPRSVFVGQSFSAGDAEVVDVFRSLLTELSFKVITGERPEAASVSEKVKTRIAEAEIFVGVLTKRNAGPDGTFCASGWVTQEVAYAMGLKKKVIILKEKDVVIDGGLQGDTEYIEFDRCCLHKALIKLIQMVWGWISSRITMSTTQSPQLNLSVMEAAVAAQPKEPMLRIGLIRARGAAGQLEAAMRDIVETLHIFPDFVPARIELIKTLRTMGRHGDAESEAKRLLESNPNCAPAHHNLAHALSERREFVGAAREFQLASDCEPGDPSHFRCYGEMLFRNAAMRREKLLEAKKQFGIAMELGDEKERARCSVFLKAIHRKLKGTSPDRFSRKAKRR